MKSKVIAQPDVQETLKDFIVTELYTDRGPAPKENAKVQVERYGTAALPLYVVVGADGKELARLELETGLATKETFLGFLRKGLSAHQAQGNGGGK
jgi:hypothetical protein